MTIVDPGGGRYDRCQAVYFPEPDGPKLETMRHAAPRKQWKARR